MSSASESLWTLGLQPSQREKGSCLPFPGHIWRLRLAMGCKAALPSCTWETRAFPKWLSTGHLALWAPLRGLQCLGGATGWDSQTGSGPVGLRPLRLDRALPVWASVSPLVRWGNFECSSGLRISVILQFKTEAGERVCIIIMRIT